MPKSFENKKQLRFVITLGTGKFGSSDNNQITLQGYRSSAHVDKAGGVQMSTLRAQIYGMSESDMNSATTLQWKNQGYLLNTIEVYAIDGAQETLIYRGNIINAWPDFRGMPEVYFSIQAMGGYTQKLQAAAPISFKGATNVATVMEQLAGRMGYAFENNGVDMPLSDIYLANTSLEQAKRLAWMAGVDLYVDDTVLAIMPKGQPRVAQVPVISRESGLVGYPTYDAWGVNFRCLFNPSITFGGAVQLETDLAQARGQWIVTSLSHHLQAETPGGAWFSHVRGNGGNFAIIH